MKIQMMCLVIFALVGFGLGQDVVAKTDTQHSTSKTKSAQAKPIVEHDFIKPPLSPAVNTPSVSGVTLAPLRATQTQPVSLSIGAILDPTSKGRAIATAAQSRDKGFRSYRGVAKMVLTDPSGAENVRDITALTIEISASEDRTSIEFQSPSDVRGVKLLTHAHADREDDQWLFLPAASRVRRIVGNGKRGNFAGSEFSYEDMMGAEIDANKFLWLRDEACPGATVRTCFVNKKTPVDPNSGYSNIIAWIDAEDFRVYKADYYDRSGSLLKTLLASDFKLYNQKYWRPMRVEMQNHANGKKTSIGWSAYEFGFAINPDDLQPFTLTR